MAQETLEVHDFPVVLSLGSEIGKQEGNKEKNQDTCIICNFWVGRCLKGRVGKLASSDTCESFQKRMMPYDR